MRSKDEIQKEALDACDVKLHYEQFGLNFKPRASDEEINERIVQFQKRFCN